MDSGLSPYFVSKMVRQQIQFTRQSVEALARQSLEVSTMKALSRVALFAPVSWTFLLREIWIRLEDDFWLFPYFCTMRGSIVDSGAYMSPGG